MIVNMKLFLALCGLSPKAFMAAAGPLRTRNTLECPGGCPPDLVCYQGSCEPSCEHGPCPFPGLTCVDGSVCLPGGGGEECPGGCAPQDVCYQGMCEPSCEHGPCPIPELTCVGGIACLFDDGEECPGGCSPQDVCYQGSCEPSCEHGPCPHPSLDCVDGIACILGGGGGEECPGGCSPHHVCYQGMCEPSCEHGLCPDPSMVCVDGVACVDRGAGCPGGCPLEDVCYQGSCVPSCDENQICHQPSCNGQEACPLPPVHCTDGMACQVDECENSCPPNLVCFQGNCFPPEVTPSGQRTCGVHGECTWAAEPVYGLQFMEQDCGDDLVCDFNSGCCRPCPNGYFYQEGGKCEEEVCSPQPIETNPEVIGTLMGGTFDTYFVAPEGADSISVKISGGTGDADLYVRKGDWPTMDNYDCRPYIGGNEESCLISNPEANATYYVQVLNYSDYTGVNLEVTSRPTCSTEGFVCFTSQNVCKRSTESPTKSPTPAPTPRPTNRPSTLDECMESPSCEKVIRTGTGTKSFTAPLDVTSLKVNIFGDKAEGIAEVSVRRGDEPTAEEYDCRAIRLGKTGCGVNPSEGKATCNIKNPVAGATYYVKFGKPYPREGIDFSCGGKRKKWKLEVVSDGVVGE